MVFVQGYQSKYYKAKIFKTEIECLEYDAKWERNLNMDNLFTRLVKFPQPQEISQFVINNYDEIQKIMEG